MNRADTLQVYPVKLTANRASFKRVSRLLSQDERERAARLRYEKDRLRWTLSRAALRVLVGRHLNLSAGDVRFALRSNGKPVISTLNCESARPSGRTRNKPPFEFNLSHSGDRALIAVSDSYEIGCDVEHVGRVNDWPAVSRRFFSPAEQRELAEVHESLRRRAFFLCWTRKEAIIKATGEGLRADLGGFDVTLKPGEPARVMEDRRATSFDDPWHLYDIPLCEDYVGAAAVRAAEPPQILVHPLWCLEDVM